MFSDRNLRYFGGALFGTGLVNLGMSLLAAKRNSLLGIAVATLIAQFALNCVLTRRLWRDHRWVSRSFLLRALVHPLIFVIVLSVLMLMVPIGNARMWVISAAVLVLLGTEFRLLGLNFHEIASEYSRLRSLMREALPRKGGS